MPPSLAGNSFLVFAVMVFVTVILLFEALYLMWRSKKGPEAMKVQRRLQALSAARDRSAQANVLRMRMLSELPVLERTLQRIPRMHGLDRLILQSGLNWTVSKLLLTSVVGFAAVFMAIVSGAHQSLALGLAGACVAGLLPLLYVRYRRSERMGRIESQLPEVLDLITRALRAGHSFSAALKMAGEEMQEPAAGEFRTVHDEVNFGVSLQQALSHLADRVPSTDVRYFVVAVLIQRESGGNLTEILSNLSRLIRERAKLMAKVRVLSSEGRLSAWILIVMPFALAGIMNLVNPAFMSRMWTDPLGITMVKYLLIMMAIGALVLRRIVRIRV